MSTQRGHLVDAPYAFGRGARHTDDLMAINTTLALAHDETTHPYHRCSKARGVPPHFTFLDAFLTSVWSRSQRTFNTEEVHQVVKESVDSCLGNAVFQVGPMALNRF
jgi:hypothetical protein